MNVKNIAIKLGKLAMLKFFPSDEGARLGILDMVCKMAKSEEQVDWLVSRMTNGLYNEWPGPRELRACFCSKFKPADGIEAHSSVYADGIPSERPNYNPLALPEGMRKALPAGHVASADKQADELVKIAVKCLPSMPSARPMGSREFRESERLLRDTITAPRDRQEQPPPTPQVITQADVDRILAERRQKQEVGK